MRQRRNVLVLSVVLAACATGQTTTTQPSTTTTEAPTTTSTSTTTTTNPLNDQVAALQAERDRLVDELGMMEDYIVSLEEDLAAWFDYALQLEAALETEPAAPADTEPSGEWCAMYQLSLENAGNAAARSQGLRGMNGHIFIEYVQEPLEDIGCPVRE